MPCLQQYTKVYIYRYTLEEMVEGVVLYLESRLAIVQSGLDRGLF
jgi:hypothetical protein